MFRGASRCTYGLVSSFHGNREGFRVLYRAMSWPSSSQEHQKRDEKRLSVPRKQPRRLSRVDILHLQVFAEDSLVAQAPTSVERGMKRPRNHLRGSNRAPKQPLAFHLPSETKIPY